jgi:hypothetical protein
MLCGIALLRSARPITKPKAINILLLRSKEDDASNCVPLLRFLLALVEAVAPSRAALPRRRSLRLSSWPLLESLAEFAGRLFFMRYRDLG